MFVEMEDGRRFGQLKRLTLSSREHVRGREADAESIFPSPSALVFPPPPTSSPNNPLPPEIPDTHILFIAPPPICMIWSAWKIDHLRQEAFDWRVREEVHRYVALHLIPRTINTLTRYSSLRCIVIPLSTPFHHILSSHLLSPLILAQPLSESKSTPSPSTPTTVPSSSTVGTRLGKRSLEV